MGDAILITQPTLGDFDKILSLLVCCNLPVSDLTQKDISRFLIATDRNDLVGTIAYESYGEYVLLRSLAVSQSYRHRGIARMLTSEMDALCKTIGFKKAFILTTTAYEFAKAQGFDVVDRADVPSEIRGSKQFSQLCPCSAICMVKVF